MKIWWQSTPQWMSRSTGNVYFYKKCVTLPLFLTYPHRTIICMCSIDCALILFAIYMFIQMLSASLNVLLSRTLFDAVWITTILFEFYSKCIMVQCRPSMLFSHNWPKDKIIVILFLLQRMSFCWPNEECICRHFQINSSFDVQHDIDYLEWNGLYFRKHSACLTN